MKNLLLKKSALTLLAGLTIGLGLVNCGGGGSSSSATTANSGTSNSYTGAGSKWDIDLKANNTFDITRRETATSAIDMNISGTYNSLASSFKELTVTASSGVNAPSVGDKAFGLEIPGYAFFLRPDSGNGELITMIQAGSCPDDSFSGNWISARNLHDYNSTTKQGTSQDVSQADSDAFGTFSWNNTNSKMTLGTTYSLEAPTVDFGAPEILDFNCTDGVATINGATMYLTSNGGMIVHTEFPNADGTTDESIITAFVAEALPSKAVFDGDYAGVLMNADISSADSLQPLAVTCDSGVCTGNTIDPATGANTGITATLTLDGAVNTPSNGFISGTIDVDGSVGKITCMVNTQAAGTTKNLVTCSGQDPADNTKLFNFILVTK